jgi:hypothetical protein
MVATMRIAGRPLQQGSGYENIPPAFRPLSKVEIARLRELATRLQGFPLDQAAANLAIYELGRRRITEVDHVIPRPLIVSEVLSGLTEGNHDLIWTWPTLGVVTGITATLYPGDSDVAGFELALAVRAGADGGWIIGTQQDPAAWHSFGTVATNGPDHIQPLPLQPTAVRSTNQWTGTLYVDDIGQETISVVLNFHGLSLWTPDGQIVN